MLSGPPPLLLHVMRYGNVLEASAPLPLASAASPSRPRTGLTVSPDREWEYSEILAHKRQHILYTNVFVTVF